MTKSIIGYLILCVVAIGGALLVLFALGAFGEHGAGVYVKIVLALAIILTVVGGMVLMVMTLSRPRGQYGASTDRDRGERGTLSSRRDRPSDEI